MDIFLFFFIRMNRTDDTRNLYTAKVENPRVIVLELYPHPHGIENETKFDYGDGYYLRKYDIYVFRFPITE